MPRKVRRVTVKRKRHRGGGFLPGVVALMAARKAKMRKKQKGGALARRKPLVDKIAQGAGMSLSGPAPSFAGVGIKLGSQAFKGIKDNVDHYRRRKRR